MPESVEIVIRGDSSPLQRAVATAQNSLRNLFAASRERATVVVNADTSGLDKARAALSGLREEAARGITLPGGLFSALNDIPVIGKLGLLLGGAGIGKAAIEVGQLAVELGNLGAVSITTRAAFESVTRSVGANTDLLSRMTAAAGGTIAQMRLMQLANTALAGASDEVGQAMANALPRLIEAARAAAQLNPAYGDAEFMFQSLVTGIKRGSPLLIDNTGLVLKLGEANERYAKQLGITVEEMSAADKQLALLQATLEAADRLITQAGGNLDGMAQSTARLSAAWADLRAAIGENLAPVISGTQTSIANAMQSLTAAIQAGSDNAAVALTGLRTQLQLAETELAQLKAQPIDPGDEFGSVAARIGYLEAKISELRTRIAELAPDTLTLSAAWSDAGVRAAMLAQQLADLQQQTDNLSPAAQAAAAETSALNAELTRLREREDAARVNAVAMAILKGEISQATVELWGLNRAYDFLRSQSDTRAAVSSMEELQKAIENVQKRQRDQRITVVAEAIVSGEISPYERNLAMTEEGLNQLYKRVMAKREAAEKDTNTRITRDYGTKLEQAGQDAARRIEGYLSQGMQASIRLLDLRGVASQFEPGANGPFENIYRLQAWINDGSWAEVAQKFGITTKEKAAEIVKAFQLGQFTPEVQALIDVSALADTIRAEQAAEASYKAFAAQVAKLAGTDTTTAQIVLKGVFGSGPTDKTGGTGKAPAAEAAKSAMLAFSAAVGDQVRGGDFAGQMIGYGETIFSYIENGIVHRAKASRALQYAIEQMVLNVLAAEFMQ